MSTPTPPHDAQRELEQRALRNVRGLVDKMDSIEKHDHRSQQRLLWGIIAGAALVVAFIAGLVLYSKKYGDSGQTVVIEPAKTAPKGEPAKR